MYDPSCILHTRSEALCETGGGAQGSALNLFLTSTLTSKLQSLWCFDRRPYLGDGREADAPEVVALVAVVADEDVVARLVLRLVQAAHLHATRVPLCRTHLLRRTSNITSATVIDPERFETPTKLLTLQTLFSAKFL